MYEDKFCLINKKDPQFYDGSKLLGMKDLNKKKPEIFISQTVRTFGKTTYYILKMFEDFIKTGDPFGILVRYKYEVSGGVSSTLSKIDEFYSYDTGLLSACNLANGNVKRISFTGKPMFYVFSLNAAKQVKVLSPEMQCITQYAMDEIQPEDNRYLPDEIEKFISIHVSLARGVGEATRYLPVYLMTNDVSYLNPYYTSLGISERMEPRTKYMRGEGFVFENLGSEFIAGLQRTSRFNRAFSSHENMNYILGKKSLCSEEVYDIMKLGGSKSYMLTLLHKGEKFGMWMCEDFVYVSKSYDPNCRHVYGIEPTDCLGGHVAHRKKLNLSFYRSFFEGGLMRFDSIRAKQAALSFLSM